MAESQRSTEARREGHHNGEEEHGCQQVTGAASILCMLLILETLMHLSRFSYTLPATFIDSSKVIHPTA